MTTFRTLSGYFLTLALGALVILVTLWQFMGQSLRAQGTDIPLSGYAWGQADGPDGSQGASGLGWTKFSDLGGPTSAAYSVVLNASTNAFAGYAWSENYGWLDFSPTGPYPESPNQAATYAPDTGQVSGWAKVVNGDALANDGFDGWVKLNGGWSNGTRVVLNDQTDQCEFTGWAWGGVAIGWISFNSINPELIAGGPAYAVAFDSNFCRPTPPPTNLALANTGSAIYCSNPWAYNFSWTLPVGFNTPQYGYQIQFDDDPNFGFELTPPDFDTGQVVGDSVAPFVYIMFNQLNFSTTYYWRLRVWDNAEVPSAWVVAATPLTTPANRYPTPAFSAAPQNPLPQQSVEYTDQTVFYDGTQNHLWAWTFENATPQSSDLQNPVVQYSDSGELKQQLTATDASGYACTAVDTVTVGLHLPKYQEVSPVQP